MGDAFQVLGTW